jgi:hypothetical protein
VSSAIPVTERRATSERAKVEQRAPSAGARPKPAPAALSFALSSAEKPSPSHPPDDVVVRGTVYHPIWNFAVGDWDFVDDVGQSLEGSARRPSLQQLLDAAAAKTAADAAVARLLSEQGPRLAELQQEIARLSRPGWQEELDGQTRRLAARKQLEEERDAIVATYDPGRTVAGPVARAAYVPLPYSTEVLPLSGPHEQSPLLLDPQQNAQYAPDLEPTQGVPFGTYGGRQWKHVAIRASINDAYAYSLETEAFQLADDLERLARAGYTEIHVASGTHGTRVGRLVAEVTFLNEDMHSINETMQRHPGLKIIPYDMADPVRAAAFDGLQALAAESRLPGGATVAAFCFSRTRVPDPDIAPSGPYASTEVLTTDAAAAYLHAGLSVGFGALAIYGGLQDPNRTSGAFKVAAGSAQVVGGTTYALGSMLELAPVARFGSGLGRAGGYAGGLLTLIDLYRDFGRKFEPGNVPLKGEEAVYVGLKMTLKLASVFYWEAAVAVLALEYGVEPGAEKASEYLTPMFLGGINEAYGVPQQFLWGMHD